MNIKQRRGEKSIGDGARRMGEFWIMMECFWSWKLKNQVVRPEQ
jgi:hypothetical protein